MVRPANLVVVRIISLAVPFFEDALATNAALSFDCSNLMLNHAAINVENHLVSLVRVLASASGRSFHIHSRIPNYIFDHYELILKSTDIYQIGAFLPQLE
jgi:hypothetical protein